MFYIPRVGAGKCQIVKYRHNFQDLIRFHLIRSFVFTDYILPQAAGLIAEVLETTTDPAAREKLQKALQLTGELDPYLDAVSPLEPLQAKIVSDTRAEPWAENFKNGLMSYTASTQMMSGPYESKFGSLHR